MGEENPKALNKELLETNLRAPIIELRANLSDPSGRLIPKFVTCRSLNKKDVIQVANIPLVPDGTPSDGNL
jgi:hypothetical protein